MVIMILILVGDWFIREYVKDWEKKNYVNLYLLW